MPANLPEICQHFNGTWVKQTAVFTQCLVLRILQLNTQTAEGLGRESSCEILAKAAFFQGHKPFQVPALQATWPLINKHLGKKEHTSSCASSR